MKTFINFIPLTKTLFTEISGLIFKLIEPKSKNEDSKRREFILNVILLGSVFLSLSALLVRSYNYFLSLTHSYTGSSPIFLFLIFSIFFILYFLCRKGYITVSSYLLVCSFFFSAFYTSYKWGVDIPTGLLVYTLTITTAGILISTRFAFAISIIIMSIIFIMGLLQINSTILINSYWRNETATLLNIIIYTIILGIITIISWLSNREIEKSLLRARKSESDLKKERDFLEIKVEERTKELKKAQEEKAMQLYRFAEFGRMSAGLFHDMLNPLTVISLSIENAQKSNVLDSQKFNINEIANNIKKMKLFAKAARQQIQNQEINITFSLIDEISLSLQMLSYKARSSKVDLVFSPPNILIQTYGNPIKFYRAVCDVVSNAIDSYDDISKNKNKRTVAIVISQSNEKIKITIKDNGCGIKKENLNKIFQPLFTTKKPEQGTGLGLPICKNVVEKDFGGNIRVYSKEGKGSIFTIIIPIRKQN